MALPTKYDFVLIDFASFHPDADNLLLALQPDTDAMALFTVSAEQTVVISALGPISLLHIPRIHFGSIAHNYRILQLAMDKVIPRCSLLYLTPRQAAAVIALHTRPPLSGMDRLCCAANFQHFMDTHSAAASSASSS